MGYFKHHPRRNPKHNSRGNRKYTDILNSYILGTLCAGVLLSLTPLKAQAEPTYVSWYGPGFDGNYTANGEIFNQYSYTAAHPSWPFGTLVQLTNYDTGAVVTVRINDRSGGVLDLAEQAAYDLGTYYAGTASVDAKIIRWGE